MAGKSWHAASNPQADGEQKETRHTDKSSENGVQTSNDPCLALMDSNALSDALPRNVPLAFQEPKGSWRMCST